MKHQIFSRYSFPHKEWIFNKLDQISMDLFLRDYRLHTVLIFLNVIKIEMSVAVSPFFLDTYYFLFPLKYIVFLFSMAISDRI